MKRLLQILLVLVVIAAAAYYFLVDGIIKSAIEAEGSKALKAKVDVGSVTFHLFPTSIALRDVQATNPRAPMRNLVQAREISVAVTLKEILDHKIVADVAQAHGLQFNQPRASSGAIPGLTPPPPAGGGLGAGLPGLSLPDAKQLLADARQHAQGELQQIRTDLTALRSNWQQKLQTLPDQAKIDSYRARAQALRNAGALEKVTGAAQLRRDIQADLNNTRQLQGQFKQDMQTAQQQLNLAKTLPERELDRLLAGAGMSREHLDNITGALLSGKLQPLIDQLLALVGSPPAANSGGGNAGAAPAANQQQWPVLARKIVLDGQIDLGKRPLRFDGVINNATPQPAFWNVPITFTLNGSGDQPGKFSAGGTLDYRKLPSNEVHFDLCQFPLEQLTLSDRAQLGIVLSKALAQVQGKLSLVGNQIDFDMSSRFDQAALAVTAGDNQIAQAAAAALRGVSAFNLDLNVSGNVKQPAIRTSSNLDTLLADAVGQQVRQQASALSGRLRAQLEEQLAPDLAAIQQTGSAVTDLQRTFADRQQALQALANLRGF
jgi:uncharacterized protein (TIGR03545 family)